MDAPRVRGEPAAPAAGEQPRDEVDVLEVGEEALVESAGGVERVAVERRSGAAWPKGSGAPSRTDTGSACR